MPKIPDTPHHHSNDLFWDQGFVDDWNTQHSPRKLFQPEPLRSPTKPKASPTKKATGAEREAKKNFEKEKHDLAAKCLTTLDNVITNGRLSELSASTGGVQIKWTNMLHTTAGRAHWKREPIRNAAASDGGARYRHHASIELAQKIITDENRLLNVVAHEFCHLATFMISNDTKSAHGKEFKSWGAKCSKAFKDRGIEVTTKHSYEIPFKYVWECVSCLTEFKRHSKSIDPTRHRCGACKSELKQTKPAPRKNATGETSEYQKFMKAHMKELKQENPGSPQKDLMRKIADRWAEHKKKGAAGVGGITAGFVDLTIEEK